MAHAMIVGMTESGKSRLGLTFARAFRRRRQLSVVLDPMYDPRWTQAADYVARDLAAFDRFCWTHKGAWAFIDESGSFGKYNAALERLVCRGRHLGHALYLITQGVKQVSPIVRAQCRTFFVFASGENDLEEIARECRQPALLTLPALGRGEFFRVARFEEIRKYSIDFSSGLLYGPK